MVTGNTTTAALADSLPTMMASARNVREFEGKMASLVDRVRLEEGTGESWNEVWYSQLQAQAITESTDLQNPQQINDSLFTVTPTMTGIKTIITDKVARRITKKGYSKLGSLAQNAIERKKDEDGLSVLDGATTSLCGAGNTLSSGHISAAGARLTGNSVEPGMGEKRAVLHSFQIHDLFGEQVAGVGTYPVSDGMTATIFKNGFAGSINGVSIFRDDNITIDGSDDAKGGVFVKEGIVLVEGMTLKTEKERLPNIGGGATAVYIYDEYAFAERLAANSTSTWLFEIYSDATAPSA
jgi:hypothetical protein